MNSLAAMLSEFGIGPADVDKARAYQKKYGGRLEQILVNMGSLSTETLPDIYARLLAVCGGICFEALLFQRIF